MTRFIQIYLICLIILSSRLSKGVGENRSHSTVFYLRAFHW